MQQLINELNNDHELITEKINEMSMFLSLKNFEEILPKLLKSILFFENFTFTEHHRREENVLYKWMVDQNKTSDKELISKIIDDHKSLEKLVKDLRLNIESNLNGNKQVSTVSIGADLSFLITKYREHIERETSFIFVIAESMCNHK
jgi:hemerythrin-like domain-containing protein